MNGLSQSHDGYFHRMPRLVDLVVVFCVGLFVNGYLVGGGPLAGTEGHRALTAHQMVISGQWLLPKLYDQYYLRKPPLHYWILGAFEVITGKANTWIWRLPSAVAAALMGAFLCLMTGRWYGRLAGLVAGISCCGLVTLWGQGRTAEIDSLNSLACAGCACLLIDLGYGPKNRRISNTVWAGLAFGAAMMIKGPAGIAVILAALIGPAIFNRDASPLKRWGPWITLLMGAAIFGAYCVAVWLRFRSMHVPADTSGLEEIDYNFFYERLKNLKDILLLPLIMLLYMVPVSFSLILAFGSGIWSTGGAKRARGFDGVTRGSSDETKPAIAVAWSESDRRMIRAIVGTLIVSCGLTMLFGLAHPRYSYVWAPLMCPIAGAVAAAWQRDAMTPWQRHAVGVLLAISSIVFAGGCAGITVVYFLREHGDSWIPVAATVLAIAICVVTIRLLQRERFDLAGWGIIATILLAAIPYADMGVANRMHHSTYFSALALKQKIPPGTTVTTGDLVMDQPELFYYSEMNVESYPDELLRRLDLPTDRWMALDELEYKTWKNDPRIRQPVLLSQSGPMVWLVWYSVDGKGPNGMTEKSIPATEPVSSHAAVHG